METEWQERFTVVVKCVYSVVLDAGNKMSELREHLFETGEITPFQFNTWPTANRVSDAKAYVLNASIIRLCDMTNEVINVDYEPIVERSAVPVQFNNIKKCIEEMLVHVVSVEEEYNLDYMVLKTSMKTAVTRLETYLLEE